MIRANTKAFVAFLRSPAQLTTVLCTTLVVTLFLQLYATWGSEPDVFGYMYFFVRAFFWFCVALGVAFGVHFGFDRLTDWMARPEDATSRKNPLPPATLFRGR